VTVEVVVPTVVQSESCTIMPDAAVNFAQAACALQ
jgi:hypothetical protein